MSPANPGRQRRAATREKPRAPLDRFTLYQLCAQNPARDARILHAISLDHPGPRRPAPTLGEDFCGTAALSRAWCNLLTGARAVAVDADAPTLAAARTHPRVRLVHADVRAVQTPVHVIAVLNFSICELHTRRALLGYLRHARSRLNAAGAGGCLICDLYGGADAFATGRLRQHVRGPRGERILYTWEQRTADPLTARVVNAMHFAVRPAGARGPVRRFDDAFVYDWRLWSVPELREAMTDAGFSEVRVYPRTADAVDQRGCLYVTPLRDAIEIGDSFNVFVAGAS